MLERRLWKWRLVNGIIIGLNLFTLSTFYLFADISIYSEMINRFRLLYLARVACIEKKKYGKKNDIAVFFLFVLEQVVDMINLRIFKFKYLWINHLINNCLVIRSKRKKKKTTKFSQWESKKKKALTYRASWRQPWFQKSPSLTL